jgi:PIN domain nuclease of toxin-antitoxin system
VRVLLDTHALLWLVTQDARLSETAKSLFLDGNNNFFLSAVTGFEIAVKFSLGKLKLAESPQQFIENRLKNNFLTALPITLPHTYRLANLPFHHRDPFDRLLVAQALEEAIPILTADGLLSRYNVESGFPHVLLRDKEFCYVRGSTTALIERREPDGCPYHDRNDGDTEYLSKPNPGSSGAGGGHV